MIPRNEVILGDAANVLKTLPSNCIDCCVTSPPYFGLRDYGIEGQIGLESDVETYIQKLGEVFAEVRRVLKSTGTLWLNVGDSYAGNNSRRKPGGSGPLAVKIATCRRGGAGLKHKDLIGIPWLLAFKLRAQGWYLRQDIIWSKGNAMPESVTDRCTKSHEYVFLLSKCQKYYFDHKAIQEPALTAEDVARRIANGNGEWKTKKAATTYSVSGTGRSRDELYSKSDTGEYVRNKRSVWDVATIATKEAHFATFPPKLIQPCILAGCPENGLVLDPFMGSGTTGMVARQLDRNYIGIELNPEYQRMAERRIFNAGENLFNQI